MPDLTWQESYRAALFESDPGKLRGRIETARRAIEKRLQQMEDEHDARERQQLNAALYALSTLVQRKRSA